jgi:CheY-like chemotaxis protein
MTANTMAEHKEACIKSGMYDYLSKPVNSDKLKVLLYDLSRPYFTLTLKLMLKFGWSYLITTRKET